jgi:excisionase family DNA binding protein
MAHHRRVASSLATLGVRPLPTTTEAAPGMSELLTLDELAARLRSGKRTAERLVARGDIRSVKVGRKRLVPEDAVEQYLRRAEKRGRVA